MVMHGNVTVSADKWVVGEETDGLVVVVGVNEKPIVAVVKNELHG